MKVLFLIFHGLSASNGISKKINYQLHAFQANQQETHFCYLSEENGIKYPENLIDVGIERKS